MVRVRALGGEGGGRRSRQHAGNSDGEMNNGIDGRNNAMIVNAHSAGGRRSG